MIGIELLGAGGGNLERTVFGSRDTDEHAGVAARSPIGGLASGIEGFPRHFEQEAMLRIHAGGFAWSDAKEGGIKRLEIVQKTTVAGNDAPRRGGMGGEKGHRIPALRGDDRYGIAAGLQQIPECCRGVGPTGKSAAETDYRDRFSGGFSLIFQPIFQNLDRMQRSPQGAGVRCRRGSKRHG